MEEKTRRKCDFQMIFLQKIFKWQSLSDWTLWTQEKKEKGQKSRQLRGDERESLLLNATSPGRNSAPLWAFGAYHQYSSYILKSKQIDNAIYRALILTLTKSSLRENSVRIIIITIKDWFKCLNKCNQRKWRLWLRAVLDWMCDNTETTQLHSLKKNVMLENKKTVISAQRNIKMKSTEMETEMIISALQSCSAK